MNIPLIQILLDKPQSEDRMKTQKILICRIHEVINKTSKDVWKKWN